MSDEEIRIAIAEACGWKYVAMHGSKTQGFWYFKISAKGVSLAEEGKLKGATPSYELPNYPNDLNAMEEAEATLNSDECTAYAKLLAKHHPTYCIKVLDDRDPEDDFWYQTFEIVTSKASLRAEAFLLVKGLWKEAEGV